MRALNFFIDDEFSSLKRNWLKKEEKYSMYSW